MIIHCKRHKAFSDSLTEESRIAKRPILAWTSELAASIRSRSRATCPDTMAMIYNNLSLILLHHEGSAAAAISCRRQIEWAIAIDRSDLAIQPLINLVRIDRLVGDRPAAMRRLDHLDILAAGRPAFCEGFLLRVADPASRDFIAAVSLVERFHFVLADDAAAVQAYFDSASYQSAAVGSSVFAEHGLQAGIIHALPKVFAAGMDKLIKNTSPYNVIVELYYRAAWAVWFEHDHRRASVLAVRVANLVNSVLASRVAIDHRFLRLTFAVAKLAARNGGRESLPLFKLCLALADRLDDVHFRLLAGHHLGWSSSDLSNVAMKGGYRTLRGVPLPVSVLPSTSIDDALELITALVEENARQMISECCSNRSAGRT